MPAKTHGFGGKEKLYSVWSNMRNRCNNPRCKDYSYYGSKGIKVCDEWSDYTVFRKWAYENGYKEGAGLSIDRVSNDGDYSPENCRWATTREQMNNMTSNHLITYKGETHSTAEWACIVGISDGLLRARLGPYGWSIEKALTTPVNAHRELFLFDGERLPLKEISRRTGINYHTLYNRIHTYGWTLEDATGVTKGE